MVFRPIKSLLFYLSHEKKERESEKCNDSNDNNESVIDYKELYENFLICITIYQSRLN